MLKLEQENFIKTKKVLLKEIDRETKFLNYLQKDAIAHNQEMIREISTDYSDPQVRVEMSQYLQSFQRNENNLNKSNEKVDKLIKMHEKPYFGRIDFQEDGYDKESLYIGISHLFDKDTMDILIYDWRSPIAGLYYENEYGRKSYEAPSGTIHGEVSLKRQFLIESGELKDYYDLKENVADEQLLQVLSSKGSEKLHSVVETIQKKQNDIIRAKDLDLLFVEGVPGSGKSIIAMHRLAYLMYNSQNKYTSKNMMIISPNHFFKDYIEEVLPELGEETVVQSTYEDLLSKEFVTESYQVFMDRVVRNRVSSFKHTRNYYILLEKWFRYYLKHLHQYEDIYYHGQVLITKEVIKSWYLNHFNKHPLTIDINKFRSRVYSNLEYLEKEVREKINEITIELNNHPLHVNSVVKGKLKQYNSRFKKHMNNMLKLDAKHIYNLMFKHRKQLQKLVDFTIPKNFFYRNDGYDDFHGVFLFKTWIHQITDYKHFKYVVIDETQDYNFVQLMLFKKLFFNAHFSVLGDTNQTIHHHKNNYFESNLKEIFNPKEADSIKLDVCYRSTEAITEFSNQFIRNEVLSFAREGKPVFKTDMNNLKGKLDELKSSYQHVAVIVHTSREASEYAEALDAICLTGHLQKLEHPVVVLPIYYAKGLEFDAVIYISNQNKHPLYKQFIYTASTRAKHELVIIEKKS